MGAPKHSQTLAVLVELWIDGMYGYCGWILWVDIMGGYYGWIDVKNRWLVNGSQGMLLGC